MDKLFNIGVADSLPEQLKGKVILTNQMTVVLFFVGLLFFIVSFSFLPVAKIALLGIILLSLGVFFLNHYKFHNASRVLISLLPPIALSLIHASIVQTNEPTLPSLSAGFISISFIPFLIFDIREKFFLAPIILAYWAIYLLQGSINQWIDVPMDSSIFYESTLAFVTNIFNISLVSFGLILFQIKNHKSEQENKDLISRLQKKQIKLATQSDFIKKQHETIALANIKLEEKVKDRTRELNEKNVLLNNYFDNLPGVVYHGKVDGTIQPSFISKGSIDVIGEAAEELVEKGIYNTDIVEPEYLKKIAEVSQQAQQAKDFPSGYELTYPIKTQTGRKWVLDKGKFTKAQNGDIFYNGIWLDITAKVEAEDTLRETKEQLQLLLESSEDMITLHNDHGTYLYYNGPKCYDIQAKDIVGKTAYDFFERESAEKITFHIKEVFQNGKSVSFESQLDWMGTKNWFSEYIYPVTDQEGRVKFVAKICRDIQTKKIAEQRLKEKEQLLSTIYNSTKDATGLLKVHPDGTYTLDSVNHSFIKTNERYGARFTEKDIKGINLTSFWKHYLNFSEQEVKTRLKALEQVKTVKENITHQTITYFENIGEVIMDSTLTPILDDQGNCEYILFVIRDNTQSILAEKALKTSQQQLSLIYNNTLDYMGLIRYKEGDDFIVESLNAPMWTWLNRTKATLKPADILEKDLFNYYKKVYGHEDKAIKERIKLFKQVAQTKESITFEGSRKVDPSSNAEAYLESTLSPILDEEGNITHVLAVIRDITGRKKVENELQASESHAKALFEYSPIIIWEEDFSEVKNYFNTLHEKEFDDLDTYFDKNPQELKQLASKIKVKDVNQKSVEFYETGSKEKHITDLPGYFIEESWQVMKAEFIALANGATTFESEIPIKNQKGEIIHFILQLAIPPEYSETWEIVIVSFIDITERKKAEQLLNQSKNEIHTQLRQNQLILETMQDGYILADTNANIVEVNPAYCKMMGYSREELLGMNINNLEANLSKAQVEERIQLMVKNGNARFESKHIRKDGGIIDFDANLSFMQFKNLPMIAAFVRDVTVEQKARQELDYRLRFESLLAKISNEFINLELNNIREGIDNALRLICKFTGFDRSFIVLFDMEQNTSSTAYEWCEPGINSVKANFQNVPFNKYPWLINKLKNNEPVVLKSLNELSPLAKQLKEDLENGNVASLIHVPILWQGDTIGFIGFDAVQHVNYFPEDLAILLRFAGEMIVNVLKRKEGEIALRASESQLSMIYNNTNEFIGLLRLENETDFYIQSFNKAVYEGVNLFIPDLDLNRYIGRKMSDFYKEVLGYSDDLINKRIEDWKKVVESEQIMVTKGELPIPYKGKSFFAFETNFIPIQNQKGDSKYILFVANDMTEKVIAEHAIKASEQRLSLIYNNNMDFIGLIRVYPDDSFKIESINHPAFAFLNKVKNIKSMKEVIGMEVSSLFKNYFNNSEAEIEERINLLKKVTQKRERSQIQDKFITRKGEDYIFESTLSPIIENDECVQILYVIKDITEQEKAKEALIHSERRLSSVFNGTKDQMAIFNIENDEKIVLEQVNQTFKDAWLKAGIDLNIDSIYGKDINFYNRVVLRLSEKKTKERLALIKQIIHNKKTFSFEDEYYALNDKNYYMEVTITPLLNDFGECSKILFVARDITFKKKADELLISKILETEDRERKRISKELHDSLGQNLTTASLNLNYLRNAITQIDDNYKIKFQNGIKFLNNAIDESRNIAHNLMPQSIVDFGYAMTIESLFEDLNQTSDTQFVFYENLGGERLASYQELSLFRITQEAVNNILKHAEASKVTLQLMKYPDMILLTIEDNGKGFEFNPNTNSNFGLNSMSTRVKALSGTIHIDSSPGIGTSITIEIPL